MSIATTGAGVNVTPPPGRDAARRASPLVRYHLMSAAERYEVSLAAGLYDVIDFFLHSSSCDPVPDRIDAFVPKADNPHGFHTFGDKLRHLADVADQWQVASGLEVLDDDDKPIDPLLVFPFLRRAAEASAGRPVLGGAVSDSAAASDPKAWADGILWYALPVPCPKCSTPGRPGNLAAYVIVPPEEPQFYMTCIDCHGSGVQNDRPYRLPAAEFARIMAERDAAPAAVVEGGGR